MFAEKRSEERNTTTVDLSFSPDSVSLSHPYIQVFRLCDNGVRVPVYRSRKSDKSSTIQVEEEAEGESEKGTLSEQISSHRLFKKNTNSKLHAFSFGPLQLANEHLVNGNKHAVIFFEIYESVSRGRDRYVGHCEVRGVSWSPADSRDGAANDGEGNALRRAEQRGTHHAAAPGGRDHRQGQRGASGVAEAAGEWSGEQLLRLLAERATAEPGELGGELQCCGFDADSDGDQPGVVERLRREA